MKKKGGLITMIVVVLIVALISGSVSRQHSEICQMNH